MNLLYGTHEEHQGTYERAKAANPTGVLRIWTGDVRRSKYLMENLEFMQRQGYATVDLDEEGDQATYFVITFIDKEKKT